MCMYQRLEIVITQKDTHGWTSIKNKTKLSLYGGILSFKNIS